MKKVIRTAQYLCGCRSYLVVYPSSRRKIFWEYDHYCKLHEHRKAKK